MMTSRTPMREMSLREFLRPVTVGDLGRRAGWMIVGLLAYASIALLLWSEISPVRPGDYLDCLMNRSSAACRQPDDVIEVRRLKEPND